MEDGGLVGLIVPRETLDDIFTPEWVDAGVPDFVGLMLLVGFVVVRLGGGWGGGWSVDCDDGDGDCGDGGD